MSRFQTGNRPPATVSEQLRLGAGFDPDERDRVVAALHRLDSRLKTFPAEGTDLLLSMKGRDSRDPRTVLECSIVGWPKLVATSTKSDVDQALVEVRDDLIRQINDTKTRMEPRNNRSRRVTGRRPAE